MSLYRWTAYLLWGTSALVALILFSEEVPVVGFSVAIAGALTGIFFLALDDIILALGGRPIREKKPAARTDDAGTTLPTDVNKDAAALRAELAILKDRA